MWQWLDDLLQLVVQHQHKGAAHASEHVGPRSLEEGLATFIACNLAPAVNSSGVHDLGCGRKNPILGRMGNNKKRTLTVVEISPPLRPDCIIIRLRTVSKGYEVRPATAVTVCAIIQLTRMWVFLGSGSIPVGQQQRLKTLLSTNHSCCFTVKNAPLAVS